MSVLIDEHETVLKRKGELSDNTIEDRIRCLRRLHEDLSCGWVYACRELLIAWLEGPAEPGRRWSPATKRVYTAHVVAGYAWLEEMGYLPDGNPAVRLPRPRLPRKEVRIATDEQLAVALTAPEPLRTAVLLATYQGLRRAECAGCWREDITEHTTTIRKAKGGEVQTVPTHPAVWAHVAGLPAGPLIADGDGVQLTPERLGYVAAAWFKAQGDVFVERGRDSRQGFGLHHFRRRFGTIIQRTHRNLRVTQECLRHKSVTTTAQAYTLVTDEERGAAVRSIPWVDGNRAAPNGPVPPAETA